MRLDGKQVYTVLAFSEQRIAVCKFKWKNKKYHLMAHAAAECSGNAASSVNTVLKEAGGAEGIILLTGILPDGEFFRCPGPAGLTIKEQRESLSFELPGRMVKVPDDPRLQFFPVSLREDGREWNVFAFPGTALNSVAVLLSQAKIKADEYFHPLLGVGPADPPLYLPSIEPDFVRRNGEWEPADAAAKVLNDGWKKEILSKFEIPEDFDLLPWMECFLAVRLTTLPKYAEFESGARILPGQLRPKRLRLQIAVAVLFFLLFAGIHSIREGRIRLKRYQEYHELWQERNVNIRKTKEMRTALKKNEKEQKEIQKILATGAGAESITDILYEITTVLPSDVLVTSFRYNDPDLDLMLQTESTNLNLAQVLKGLSRWKINQLNQRSMNSSLSMIFLKLSPKEDSARNEK